MHTLHVRHLRRIENIWIYIYIYKNEQQRINLADIDG